MPFIQILLTAASLSAIAGGTWSIDRAMDRYARIPAAEQIAAALDDEAEEDDASEDVRVSS